MTPLGSHHSKAKQQHEIREARRMLKETVRNDWDYPALPAYQRPTRRRPLQNEQDEEARVAGFRFQTPSNPSRERLELEVVDWRERACSSESDLSDGNESAGSTSSKDSKRSKKSKYKFDGPDSVGAQIQDRRTARKRKRQKDLEKEMRWNDGLRHWMSRRDAWAGARTAAQVDGLEETKSREEEAVRGTSLNSAGGSTESTPRTSTSSNVSAPPSSTATTPDPAPPSSHLARRPPSLCVPQAEVLVPVCPAILPNHPIRRKLSASMYNEIYSKIILQSRTPSVPINLLTLISALVQGWKDDGEWPPKSGPLEPSIAKRRSRGRIPSGSSVKDGLKAVGRVLRLTVTSEASSQRTRDDR